VTNILGTEVAVLHSGKLEAGWHSFTFNGGSLPGGKYIAILNASGVMTSRLTSMVK
jgi:hypothetical protein